MLPLGSDTWSPIDDKQVDACSRCQETSSESGFLHALSWAFNNNVISNLSCFFLVIPDTSKQTDNFDDDE